MAGMRLREARRHAAFVDVSAAGLAEFRMHLLVSPTRRRLIGVSSAAWSQKESSFETGVRQGSNAHGHEGTIHIRIRRAGPASRAPPR